MDPAQIIILIVIGILTILLLVLGTQVYFVLKELRQTLTKTNKILDTATELTENIANPINAFSSVLTGVKMGNVIAGIFKKIQSKEEK